MRDDDQRFLKLALETGHITRSQVEETEHALARDPELSAPKAVQQLGLLDGRAVRALLEKLREVPTGRHRLRPGKKPAAATYEESHRIQLNRKRSNEFFGPAGTVSKGEESGGFAAPGTDAGSSPFQADDDEFGATIMEADPRMLRRPAPDAEATITESPGRRRIPKPPPGGRSVKRTKDGGGSGSGARPFTPAPEATVQEPRARVSRGRDRFAHDAEGTVQQERPARRIPPPPRSRSKKSPPEAAPPLAGRGGRGSRDQTLLPSIGDESGPTRTFDAAGDGLQTIGGEREVARARDRQPTVDADSDGHGRVPPSPGQRKKKKRKKKKKAQKKKSKDDDPLIGQTIGGCTIERFLGAGGMGSVYLATHIDLDRKVAFKVLSDQLTKDPNQVRQFMSEAKALARVEHPNIVTIYNVGNQEEIYFLQMQLVEGGSLQDWIKREEKASLEQSVEFVAQIAKGLAAAHRKGVVHRDIKPDNVLVADGPILQITDFGLAFIDEENLGFKTDRIVGTPYFMAPEQIDGRLVDRRTDVYALGATWYYLLTGKHPFEGDSAVEVLLMHINDPLIPPRELDATIPEPISALICRMMAKEADDRYETLEAFLKDLDAVRSGQNISLLGPSSATKTAAPKSLFTDDEGKPVETRATIEELQYERPKVFYVAAAAVVLAFTGLLALALGPLREAIFASASAIEFSIPERPEDPTFREIEQLVHGAKYTEAKAALEEIAAMAPDKRDEASRRIEALGADVVEVVRIRVEGAQADVKAGAFGAAIERLLTPEARAARAFGASELLVGALAEVRSALVERGLVYVPAGVFAAGEGAADGPNPPRQESLNGFYIDRLEVTRDQFAAFLVAHPEATVPAGWDGPQPPADTGALPVTGVSVDQARAYARYRGGRLPTAAEWQKAAAWDALDEEVRVFPWGDRPGPANLAPHWASRGGVGRALPGGALPNDTSPSGAVDMAGNVAEWVFGPPPHSKTGHALAGLCGGSYLTHSAEQARAAFVRFDVRVTQHEAIGFRLVYDKLPE